MHHAAILRSPHAAAKIRSIDIQPAADLKGVVAVFTGKDTENAGPGPVRRFAARPARPASQPPGDRSRVFRRAPGGRRRRHRPLHRARWRRSDRSRLRAATRRRRSRKSPRPRRSRGASASGPTTSRSRSTRKAATSTKAFAEADVIVKQRIVSQRLIPNSMETRGVVADWKCGRPSTDPVHLHAGPAPGAHAGGADAGTRRKPVPRGRPRSRRRLRRQAPDLRRRNPDGASSP